MAQMPIGRNTVDSDKFQGDASYENARKEMEKEQNIPEGFIECNLSTEGKITEQPASFHIRNLQTEDLLQLGVAEQQDLPKRLSKMLNSIIWEYPKVDVTKFHEKEVIELILYIYESYYSPIMANQTWEPTDEDWEFLKKQCGGEDTQEFIQKKQALENGSWKPVFDIPLDTAVSYYKLPAEGLKTAARIKRGDSFECVYGLPLFGDVLVLQEFLDKIWKEKDRQFANIGDILKRRQEAEDKQNKGELVNLRAIPNCTADDRQKYKEYELDKSIFSLQAVRALHLKEVTGSFIDANGKTMQLVKEDVSNWPLEKKMILAKHPYLDNQTFTEIKKQFDNLQFGINKKIHVKDPIIGTEVDRDYSFRLDDILAAMRDKGPSDVTISFE